MQIEFIPSTNAFDPNDSSLNKFFKSVEQYNVNYRVYANSFKCRGLNEAANSYQAYLIKVIFRLNFFLYLLFLAYFFSI